MIGCFKNWGELSVGWSIFVVKRLWVWMYWDEMPGNHNFGRKFQALTLFWNLWTILNKIWKPSPSSAFWDLAQRSQPGEFEFVKHNKCIQQFKKSNENESFSTEKIWSGSITGFLGGLSIVLMFQMYFFDCWRFRAGWRYPLFFSGDFANIFCKAVLS